ACAEPGAGDGLDPRYDVREAQRPAKRKALQLCREVERTLNAVLTGECADPVLRDLTVVSVVPAPNAVRLLVTVDQSASQEGISPEGVLDHLRRAAGLLRSETAAAVRRRKAPELVFRVVTGE